MKDATDNIGTHLPKWIYWVWLVAIVALGMAIAALFIGVTPYVCWNVEIVSVSIILAFVGILATFVVVSNYAQVKDIENKINSFENKVTGAIDKKIEESESKMGDVILFSQILTFREHGNFSLAFVMVLGLIENYVVKKMDDEEIITLVDTLNDIIRDIEHSGHQLSLYPKSIENYIKILYRANVDETNYAIDFLNKLKQSRDGNNFE
jgi:hypothetical protein